MDSFLENMTYQQAREWELFTKENPLPEDVIIMQIAKIAHLFANAYVKRKDKQPWKITDFIPDFSTPVEKPSPRSLKQKLFGFLGKHGDEKARKWKEKEEDKIKKEDEYVIGTDGKKYKYAMEEFARKRTKLPKRLMKGKR